MAAARVAGYSSFGRFRHAFRSRLCPRAAVAPCGVGGVLALSLARSRGAARARSERAETRRRAAQSLDPLLRRARLHHPVGKAQGRAGTPDLAHQPPARSLPWQGRDHPADGWRPEAEHRARRCCGPADGRGAGQSGGRRRPALFLQRLHPAHGAARPTFSDSSDGGAVRLCRDGPVRDTDRLRIRGNYVGSSGRML